jgi:serine/threonine protein kinase
MSDSEASSVESKRIHGIVEKNGDFKRADGQIWHQNPKPLGEGGYSQVYLYENGGSKWAVKRIPNISAGGRTTSAELEKEKAALIKFSDRERFVSFIGWFAYENIEYFALEYVELGDLEDNLKEREKAGGRLPEAEVQKILTQILEGVEIMHAEGYIHRDLKPQVRHHHHHLAANHWVIYISSRISLSHKKGLTGRSKSQT